MVAGGVMPQTSDARPAESIPSMTAGMVAGPGIPRCPRSDRVFGFIAFSLSGLLEPGRLLVVLLGGWWPGWCFECYWATLARSADSAGPRLPDGGPAAARQSEEPDNPGLACPVVSDHKLAAGSQLGVDELVRRDRAVDEISLRHVRALLELTEMVLGRRYQRDRYAPTRSLRPFELPGRVGGHRYHLFLWGWL